VEEEKSSGLFYFAQEKAFYHLLRSPFFLRKGLLKILSRNQKNYKVPVITQAKSGALLLFSFFYKEKEKGPKIEEAFFL